MRVQAIEHRICVAVLAGDTRDVIKTNNYRNIQFFEERSGRFELNGANMGGTWTSATRAKSYGQWQAIPKTYFGQYLDLLAGLA